MRKKYQEMDLSGRRFGALTVISPADRTHHNSSCWLCRCDCGNNVKVSPSNLVKGIRTSCGCQIWKGMKRSKSTAMEGYHPTDVYPRNGKWLSMITWKGRQYALGYYDTLNEASAARNGARKLIQSMEDDSDAR